MATFYTNYVFTQYAVFQAVKPDMAMNLIRLEYVYNPITKPFLDSTLARAEQAYYPLVKPFLNIAYPFIQYACRSPETSMSNDVFPGSATGGGSNAPMLRGTTYSTMARPMFKTKVAEHTGGNETATSYMDSPKWEFELGFDWLPNRSFANNTDFKTLCGFFLSRKGRFDTFLFRAPDDYYVENLVIGTGDGANPSFPLFRPMGSFEEPIGQVDEATLSVWVDGNVTKVIPITPGPYTVDLDRDILSISSVSIEGSGLTDVSPAMPVSVNQYSVSGSVFTFYSTRQGQTVVISCKYLATSGIGQDYSVLLPRTVVFDDAPPVDAEISATFEFNFVCRFTDDQTEFEQFADQLWSNGELTFRSVPT